MKNGWSLTKRQLDTTRNRKRLKAKERRNSFYCFVVRLDRMDRGMGRKNIVDALEIKIILLQACRVKKKFFHSKNKFRIHNNTSKL